MFLSCAKQHRIRSDYDFNEIKNWVCVYNENASPDDIRKFDLAVLDADAHPDLSEIKKSNTIILGYVSLGEVGAYRWYWKYIAKKPWILDKNPNWDGFMIDVRAKEWHAWLLHKIIPQILAQGFDGLFLDTIDNAEYLEKYHLEKKYPGARQGMINLIKAIRSTFPDIYILSNRGYTLLPKIAEKIDGVVAESIFTTFEANKKQALRLRKPEEYKADIQHLLKMKKKFRLLVLSLDYVIPENKSLVQSIITKSRQNGLVPYLSTRELDTVFDYTLQKL